MSEWVSVKEKLPDYTATAGSDSFVHVLVALTEGLVMAAMYCNEKFVIIGNIDATQYITHWMPLPAPPEKIKEHEGER